MVCSASRLRENRDPTHRFCLPAGTCFFLVKTLSVPAPGTLGKKRGRKRNSRSGFSVTPFNLNYPDCRNRFSSRPRTDVTKTVPEEDSSAPDSSGPSQGVNGSQVFGHPPHSQSVCSLRYSLCVRTDIRVSVRVNFPAAPESAVALASGCPSPALAVRAIPCGFGMSRRCSRCPSSLPGILRAIQQLNTTSSPMNIESQRSLS